MSHTEENHEHLHVKFDEHADNFSKHNCILIQRITPWKLQIHLGFLKLNHTYDIQIQLEIPEHTGNEDWIARESSLSAYSSLKSYERVGDKGNLHLNFKAGKAKLMSDTVKLTSSTDPTIQLELVLLARVLGKGQGTPMLKDGIHCVAVEADEESDASDWQGFE